MARNHTEQLHEVWLDALDAIEDAVFIHDREFRILHCNRAYRQCAGLPLEEILGHRYFKIFPKSDAPLKDCASATQENSVSGGQETVLRIQGRSFRSRSHAITDEKGNYRYSVHILEDVTKRQKTEKQRHADATFYETVLNLLPIGIAVNSVEPTVAFTYMNDSFPNIYRTTKERLKTPDAFWEAVYEEPIFRKQMKKRVLEDCADGNIQRMRWNDIPITRKGEETRFVSAQNIPLPEQNSVISIVQDITERKRAEKKLDLLNSIIENVPAQIFWKDKDLRYLGCNTAFAQDAGTTPDEIIGRDDYQLAWGEVAESLRADDQQVIDSGMPKIGFEESIKASDGQKKHLRTSKVPLLDAQKKHYRYSRHLLRYHRTKRG